MIYCLKLKIHHIFGFSLGSHKNHNRDTNLACRRELWPIHPVIHNTMHVLQIFTIFLLTIESSQQCRGPQGRWTVQFTIYLAREANCLLNTSACCRISVVVDCQNNLYFKHGPWRRLYRYVWQSVIQCLLSALSRPRRIDRQSMNVHKIFQIKLFNS